MAEKVYPSKPPATATAAATPAAAAAGGGGKTLNGGSSFANPQFPASKGQLYGAARPPYRPQPPPRRRRPRRRGCLCSCCLWLTFLIVTLLILAAAAGAIFWALYRPQRPKFAVSSFRISQLNLTSSPSAPSRLLFKANLTVRAENPNKKLRFLYDPASLAIDSGGVPVGSGVFPAFEHDPKNVTVLKAAIASSGEGIADDDANRLRSDLKGRKGLPLTIRLETKVGVKVGALKTKKVKIRVSCDGIRAAAPAGKTAAPATTDDVKCNVDLRVKIWKWTF